MAEKLAWGILGAGIIARTFAIGVSHSRTGIVAAVASRSQEKADQFGEELNIPRRYGSYEAMLGDPAVQAVYIATPHPQHIEWATKAMKSKKHVLCEKPIGINFAEAMSIVENARENDVFLMEAYMYRCHPQMARIIELIKSKAIGDIRVIHATFSYHWPKPFNPDSRLTRNDLAGGAILDVGGYPISLCRLVAGAANGNAFENPTELKALGHLESTGADGYALAAMKFPGEILAQCSTGMQCNQENVVRIYGTDGWITILDPWVPARESGTVKIILNRDGKPAEEIAVTTDQYLYGLEADMVADHISQRQAPAMNWEDTLGNARALDQWRSQIGLLYESEKLPNLKRTAYGRPLARQGGNMKYSKIAGIDQPISILGSGADFSAGANREALLVWDDFFERGGNFYDTAYLYGQDKQYTSDHVLGHWIASRGVRKQTVILGKGGHPPLDSLAEITRQLHQSLENGGFEYFDLFMLHRDQVAIPVGEYIDVLNEHKKAGLIRAFGGSNWTLPRVQAAQEYAARKGFSGFSAVSNQFSLARMVNPVWAGCVQSSDQESCAWHTQTQLPQIAWSSQAKGFFVPGVAQPDKRNDVELVRGFYSEDNFKRQQRAFELAAKKNVLPIQLALAYVLCQPFPNFALIGPRQISETRTSLQALDIQLTQEELKWLNLEI